MTGGGGPGAERVLGRYALFDEIAAGGMATVHLGRMLGPVGFSKTVAIKRLHPHLAHDPEFVSMFLDEARLAARIQHPNVVATLDVVAVEGEVFLVLDYVQGESLSHLLKATRIKHVTVAPRVVASVLVNALHGLHAAHEARDERGNPLGIVHRDVSPQNLLVGIDGVARVLDFGVAKAAGRLQSTRDGQLKGKLAYMAPEQIRGEPIDRRTDVYAAAVVLWEGLAGRRLVHGLNEGQVLAVVLAGNFPPPSSVAGGLPPAIDAVVMRGLSANPAARFGSAREMAIAVEKALGVASPYEVAEWVQSVGAEALAMRAARVREMESTSAVRVSLHDENGPQVFHDSVSRPFDRGRSGVSVVTGTGSVQVHPSMLGPGSDPTSGLHQPAAAAPMPFGPPPLPASHAPTPTAPAVRTWNQAAPAVPLAARPRAPASRVKVALLSAGISAVFGITVIAGIFWWRARSVAADVEPVPAVRSGRATPSAPASKVAEGKPATPAPSPSAPSAVVDVPPVSVDDLRPEPHAAKPAAKTATPAAEKPAAAPAKPAASSSPAKPAAKPAKGCESPFYVDDNGIKHIKPECM